MATRAAVSQQDVDKLRKGIAEAEAQLQKRLAAVNKTSVDITRRLDYTYYNLLEKVGHLVALVRSFHSLSSQTQELTDTFNREASTVEEQISAKIQVFKTTFDERQGLVRALEERSSRATAQARELGVRLEAARQRVEAWEKKDGEERRRRSWLWMSLFWSVVVVVVAILVAVSLGSSWEDEERKERQPFSKHQHRQSTPAIFGTPDRSSRSGRFHQSLLLGWDWDRDDEPAEHGGGDDDGPSSTQLFSSSPHSPSGLAWLGGRPANRQNGIPNPPPAWRTAGPGYNHHHHHDHHSLADGDEEEGEDEDPRLKEIFGNLVM